MSIDLFNKKILPLKDKLFRMAWLILRNYEDAEDIVQDILLKLWSMHDEWESIDNIEAYCYRSVRNLALDKQASMAFRQTDSMEERTVPVTVDFHTPHTQFVGHEQHSLIYKCVDLLSPIQKSIFQLREIEEMSYKQIADTLNITEESVKVNLFRARKKMKELLSQLME